MSKKKQSSNGDVHTDRSVVDEVLKGKSEKSVICNFSSDWCPNWDAVDVKSGMDVVSFTFTSPIKKSVCGPQSSDTYNDRVYLKTSSSTELDVIGRDALSLLLEQKLKELASKVESCSADMSTPQEKKVQLGMQKEKRQHEDCTSVNGCQFSQKHELQQLEEMEEQSSGTSNIEYGKGFDCHLSTASMVEVEPSFTDTSCNYSDTKFSITFDGKGGKCLCEVSYNWQLVYIRDIINRAEYISDNILLDPDQFIKPNLFDHLENQINSPDRNLEEYSKLERKVLFDCVSERLEFRRKRLFGEGFKSWVKWTRFFRRIEQVGDELYKEINGWASMGELMVDELVEKDMSNQNGKWLDFEVEEFEEGAGIQESILNFLVDELVVDLFLS